MIPQNEFTAEIADYIKTYIQACALGRQDLEAGAQQCAQLITSLARATAFEPWPDPGKRLPAL